jgi:hypothetical protein
MQYNSYAYTHAHSSQQTPNIPSAPPLDEDNHNHNHMHQIPQNDIHFQQPYLSMYPYPNGPYMTPHIPIPVVSVDQQIQMRKNQEQDNCCCVALMAFLCCCLY